MAKREQKLKNRGGAGLHKKTGEEFLEKNRKKEDVIETDSGLQYQVIEEGNGNIPDEYSKLVIHQRALLLNGTILEDTYRKNQPDEVKYEELIDGLKEGVLLMKEGSRYKFWVPPELGWGRKGTSGKIPPFAVISFDIRLISTS
ncbi:FKBP-type peptidyl-prolyl cis-trans isomerase [Saccharicrinis sp. FJH62]|uniref:FKBP-type peptidyl-prolyl cis-trans isomerase n=1 Tax=Saccharicrinis sp. FJH62 TaxID=3344657 RepID=UPI0035D4DD37